LVTETLLKNVEALAFLSVEFLKPRVRLLFKSNEQKNEERAVFPEPSRQNSQSFDIFNGI
jgi:hypothetical protein